MGLSDRNTAAINPGRSVSVSFGGHVLLNDFDGTKRSRVPGGPRPPLETRNIGTVLVPNRQAGLDTKSG